MWTPIEQLSEEGYDLQWGTNVVGHFYFAQLLMPALLAGVRTSPDHHARVITTSSSGAYLQTLEYDTFRDGRARRELGSTQLYYQSKHVRSSPLPFFDWACNLRWTTQGNAIVARQMAKRYADRGIISISVNPGTSTPFCSTPRVLFRR